MPIQRVVRFLPALLLVAFQTAPDDARATSHDQAPADLCLKLDQNGQALDLTRRPSPDCLQIKPGGELRPAGDPSRCVALAPGSKSMVLVDGVSVECAKIDLMEKVEVIKTGATACLGFDRSAGVINVLPVGSPDCLQFDSTTGGLTPVASPTACLGVGPGAGVITVLRAGSPDCLQFDSTTGGLRPVASGKVIAPGRVAFDPRPRDRLGVRFGVRYAELKAPRAGVGTLITDGIGSVDAIIARQDAEGMDIDVSLLTPTGAWEVEYFDGDATSTAREPVNGAQVGFVYHQPSPSGSLGLNTGRNGGEFRLATDVKFFYFSYRPPFALRRYESEDCKFDLRPELSFGHLRTDYQGWSQSSRFPGIFSETRQEIEENRFGVGLRGHYSRRLADFPIVGRVVLNLDVLYRDADLDSWQRNVCSASGCPPSATFDANVRDSDSGVTWQVGLKGGIDYSFDRNSRVGLEVGYRYLADTAALQNPTSTIDIDRPPHLRKASASAWNAGLTWRQSF